jgi:hypothetical protein
MADRDICSSLTNVCAKLGRKKNFRYFNMMVWSMARLIC